jgi:D-serine deaminase-like pyridoxal phosphate-dependent protein
MEHALQALQDTFLMERYWPGVARADVAMSEERLCRAAGELRRDGTPIRIVSSTWIPADEVVLTLFEAGEQDDVLEVSRRGGYPFDRMQRVEVVTEASRRWRGDEEHV